MYLSTNNHLPNIMYILHIQVSVTTQFNVCVCQCCECHNSRVLKSILDMSRARASQFCRLKLKTMTGLSCLSMIIFTTYNTSLHGEGGGHTSVLLERCPYFRGCYVQASVELGPTAEDVSLLERCPHFRGCYVQASLE